MEKILIKENAELAEQLIEQVQKEFINYVSDIANAITGLGMKPATKGSIIDAITQDGAGITKEYEEWSNSPDGNSLLSSVIQDEATERLQRLHNAIERYKYQARSGISLYGRIRISSPKLFDWFEVSKEGFVYMLQSIKDDIREGVKLYTLTKEGFEMYQLQQQLVETIQKLYDKLYAVVDSGDKTLDVNTYRAVANFPFPRGMYEVRENQETGRLIFQPTSLNFDPEAPIE